MDQADRLRQLINIKNSTSSNNNIRVITVSSGKGGVGKTNFVINLAVVLKNKGYRVAILDADFGMANVDILFGIRSRNSIYDLLYGNKSIDDIAVTTSEGIKIVPGGSGIKELSEIDEEKRQKLLQEFSKLQNIDILLVDTGAGMSPTVLNFVSVADDVIVVTNSEPTSLTDAYGLIKVIISNQLSSNLNLVINKVSGKSEGIETYDKLSNTVQRFLNSNIKYLGYVEEDLKVSRAVREQRPFTILYPKCAASQCLEIIASKLLGESVQLKSSSIKDYFSRLLKTMRG